MTFKQSLRGLSLTALCNQRPDGGDITLTLIIGFHVLLTAGELQVNYGVPIN